MRIQPATGQHAGRVKPVTAEGLVNLYAEKSPDNGLSNVVLHGTPGLTLYVSCGTGPVRGMWRMGNLLYAVSGNKLYRVNDDSTSTELGTIGGSSRVGMADNGTQLVIVNGSQGFIYSVSGGLVGITDPDFPGADTVTYMDGYFIFNNPSTGQFFISALYDGSDIDSLDFATAESSPDPLVAVMVDHRELWLFGDQTTEIWSNTGAADFPFARITGAVSEKGCSAKHSIARLDNSIFWLDRDGIVRRANGYSPVRISTHAIEYDIAQSDYTTATAFSYAQEGHEFYVLSTDTGTFVFDAATGEWHKRESYGEDRWRVDHYAYCYGDHFVGDFETGAIYTLSLDTFSEDGADLVATMTFSPIGNDGDRFRLHSFQLDLETSDDPADVMLLVSKDGKTWNESNWSSVDFENVGRYGKRAVWRRLGQYRNAHVRVRISDPVKRGIYSAYVKVEPDG